MSLSCLWLGRDDQSGKLCIDKTGEINREEEGSGGGGGGEVSHDSKASDSEILRRIRCGRARTALIAAFRWNATSDFTIMTRSFWAYATTLLFFFFFLLFHVTNRLLVFHKRGMKSF